MARHAVSAKARFRAQRAIPRYTTVEEERSQDFAFRVTETRVGCSAQGAMSGLFDGKVSIRGLGIE